jgi:transposase
MLDLYHATRDELIRTILAQQDLLAAQERRLATLEAQLTEAQATIARLTAQLGALTATDDDAPRGGTPTGMPGLKPTEAPAREKAPRRKRAHGAARHRMTPTARVVHALATCPDCGAPLAGGTVKRTREVIELPAPTVSVTEHVYLERRCPDCGKRCLPQPELAGIVAGQSRLGNRLVSLIAVLREQARLPFATIQTLLATLYGLELSVGALVGAVQRVATAGKRAVTALKAAIRASPVVHADETGWREDGHNGYVWTFSTPAARLFVHDTREKRVLTETLGDAFAGVLVSDFYGAYTGYDGQHQYCWAHLLRDIQELAADHPADARLQGWAGQVQSCFARAQAALTMDTAPRARDAQQVRADLVACCAPWLPTAAEVPDPPVLAAHRRLCQRITRSLPELLTFLTETGVPPTNNAAERSLRPLVVSRKISGGTRSDQGSQTKMTLASLFGSWRLQRVNPFAACQELLATPYAE